jgi:hypothetical protein
MELGLDLEGASEYLGIAAFVEQRIVPGCCNDE